MRQVSDLHLLPPVAPDLFWFRNGHPTLVGGRRKTDGKLVFPLPGGDDRDLYEAVPLGREGHLWSFTVQRFRPKSPPYAGADGEAGFRFYTVGYVELPGEIIVESRIDVDGPSELVVGMPMRLTLIPFERPDGVVATYAFRPTESVRR